MRTARRFSSGPHRAGLEPRTAAVAAFWLWLGPRGRQAAGAQAVGSQACESQRHAAASTTVSQSFNVEFCGPRTRPGVWPRRAAASDWAALDARRSFARRCTTPGSAGIGPGCAVFKRIGGLRGLRPFWRRAIADRRCQNHGFAGKLADSQRFGMGRYLRRAFVCAGRHHRSLRQGIRPKRPSKDAGLSVFERWLSVCVVAAGRDSELALAGAFSGWPIGGRAFWTCDRGGLDPS